jgi:hypothetical protein
VVVRAGPKVFGKSSGGSNEVFLMKIIIVVTVNLTVVSSKFALALSGYAVKLVALGPITYIPPHTIPLLRRKARLSCSLLLLGSLLRWAFGCRHIPGTLQTHSSLPCLGN